jgi:hypothetical protein
MVMFVKCKNCGSSVSIVPDCRLGDECDVSVLAHATNLKFIYVYLLIKLRSIGRTHRFVHLFHKNMKAGASNRDFQIISKRAQISADLTLCDIYCE